MNGMLLMSFVLCFCAGVYFLMTIIDYFGSIGGWRISASKALLCAAGSGFFGALGVAIAKAGGP
jgi:hypothetical protein